MSSKQVGLHEEALAEAQAAYMRYSTQDSKAADGFIDELDQAIEQVGAFPQIGSPYRSGTRRYVLRRFPFVVIYRETARAIEIVAIAHAHRKPGYWKPRLT